MGVERQGAKINWLTSLALVVAAGTFYRLRNLTQLLSRTQVKDLMIKLGLLHPPRLHQTAILPRPPTTSIGNWQRTRNNRVAYGYFYRIWKLSEGNIRRLTPK